DNETLIHYARWARVHMKLYPYLLAIAQQASATGAPMMRQLALEFPTDPRAWTTADEYLLGPSLLVAPAAQSGGQQPSVYFPAGNWYPVFAKPGVTLRTGGDHQIDALLGELPVYARAGSIIPLLPDGVQTVVGTALPVPRELWVFPGGAADIDEPGGSRWQL